MNDDSSPDDLLHELWLLWHSHPYFFVIILVVAAVIILNRTNFYEAPLPGFAVKIQALFATPLPYATGLIGLLGGIAYSHYTNSPIKICAFFGFVLGYLFLVLLYLSVVLLVIMAIVLGLTIFFLWLLR